jgi:hypothetical protein
MKKLTGMNGWMWLRTCRIETISSVFTCGLESVIKALRDESEVNKHMADRRCTKLLRDPDAWRGQPHIKETVGRVLTGRTGWEHGNSLNSKGIFSEI